MTNATFMTEPLNSKTKTAQQAEMHRALDTAINAGNDVILAVVEEGVGSTVQGIYSEAGATTVAWHLLNDLEEYRLDFRVEETETSIEGETK